MKQFDKYRMVDGATPLAARYFNPVWQDVDLRIAALEDLKIAWQAAVDEVVRFGLVRIDELITEPLQAVVALSEQAQAASTELDQLRQLAQERTAALAALIETLQADTAAQVNAFITTANGSITAHQNATAAELADWKAQRTQELDTWVADYEAQLLAARAEIDAAIAGLDQRVTALEQNAGSLTITSSQTIEKSIFGSAAYVFVELWAGGGSGAARVNSSRSITPGGEGGEYSSVLLRMSDLAPSVILTIGAGGDPVSSTASGTGLAPTAGNPGGDTLFGNLLKAAGGLGAGNSSTGPAKCFLAGKNGGDGGGDSVSSRPSSVQRTTVGPGGDSVFGGGGGGASSSVAVTMTAGGTSQFGGKGGDGVEASSGSPVASSGTAPSGAGGGCQLLLNIGTATSGAGARGQARLTWW